MNISYEYSSYRVITTVKKNDKSEDKDFVARSLL